MRRFAALPSGVSFGATGCVSASETALHRCGGTPRSVRIRTTLAARAPASSQLLG